MSAITNLKRLALGLALAPLVPGVLMLALSMLGNPSEGIWALKLIAMIAYPAMLIIGLPLHLLFRGKGRTSVSLYLVTGAIAGAAVAYCGFPTLQAAASGAPTSSSTAIAVICAFFGMITAATFWLIVRPNIGNQNGPR